MPRVAPRHPLIGQLSGVARVEPGGPGGPELAYDFSGRVVASVYTIAWRDLINTGFTSLPPSGRAVDHVSTYALPEDADLPGPACALVLWHVSEQEAAALR
jgi:hypothetical protein